MGTVHIFLNKFYPGFVVIGKLQKKHHLRTVKVTAS